MAFVIITSALIDYIHSICVSRDNNGNMTIVGCKICPDSNITGLRHKAGIIGNSLPTAGACIPCIVATVTFY